MIFSLSSRYFLVSLLITYVKIVKHLQSHAVCDMQDTYVV
jgi:hypothetical protein